MIVDFIYWMARKVKSPNLPAWKKVSIDIEHIASGHIQGGNRASPRKHLFPINMTKFQVEKVIKNAYRYSKRIKSQDDRVLVRGRSNGLTIEMWVNITTKTIETAYPINTYKVIK